MNKYKKNKHTNFQQLIIVLHATYAYKICFSTYVFIIIGLLNPKSLYLHCGQPNCGVRLVAWMNEQGYS